MNFKRERERQREIEKCILIIIKFKWKATHVHSLDKNGDFYKMISGFLFFISSEYKVKKAMLVWLVNKSVSKIIIKCGSSETVISVQGLKFTLIFLSLLIID